MGKKKRGGGKSPGDNADIASGSKSHLETPAPAFSGPSDGDFPELGAKPEKSVESKFPQSQGIGRGRGTPQQPLPTALPHAPSREKLENVRSEQKGDESKISKPQGIGRGRGTPHPSLNPPSIAPAQLAVSSETSFQRKLEPVAASSSDLQQFPSLSISEKPAPASFWSKGKELQGHLSSDTAATIHNVKQSDKAEARQDESLKKQLTMPPAKTEVESECDLKRSPPRSSKSYKPIPRPNYGTRGTKIALKANFFKLEFRDDQVIYHYDIDIKPEIKNKEKTRLIFDAFAKSNKATLFKDVMSIFDGRKNVYTNKALKLPTSKVRFEIKLNDDNPKMKPFILHIQYAAQISLSSLADFLKKRAEYPNQAVQSLDVALRESPNHRHIPLGQYFFTMSVGPIYNPVKRMNEPGLELLSGCYQSVRPGWKCMMLQVDASVRVFHKGQRVVDLCSEFFGCSLMELKERPLNAKEHGDFESHIKGLQIEIDTVSFPQLTRRSYKLIGLSKQTSKLQTFPMAQPDGKEIPTKVSDYFRNQYKINLDFPDLHCLQAQPADKHRYLPMEICVIKKGQQLKRLNDVLTSQLIKYSAVPATDREANINKIVGEMNYKNDSIAKGFGMSISDKMIEFEGRILPAPKIEYSGEKKIDVRDGSWNMQRAQFFSKAEAKEMAVVDFDRTPEGVLKEFVNQLISCAKEVGMILPAPKRYVQLRNVAEVAKCMKSLLPMQHPSLIIVVLPSQKSNDIYGEVKKVGDLDIGIATQCVQSKNVRMVKFQTLGNICLKINAKLGETNSVIARENKSSIMNRPVMIMGADVTHPAPGDFSNPSIAAVTGSYDPKAYHYAAKISMQKHRQEIIADLEGITKQLLENFKEKNKGKDPEKILFYRDGVSEGQFREVLSSELTAIQKACYSFGGKEYQPSITFITVQKRHHTRLFAKNTRQQVGKSKNVPAGTTVDTDIVHPIEFDFYLCSHQGIQGTSRPAHYYVLYDDSNFSADLIQDFTYHLCHLYARCTRSVSIPAPVYYAHHCAFRGRYYLDRMGIDGKLPDKDNDAARVLSSMNSRCLIHNNYKGMFFA